MLEHVTAVYFSPTGSSKRIALFLAQCLAEQVGEVDLSVPELSGFSFKEREAVVAAGPVFGGRIPSLMRERLEKLQGNGAWLVSLAVYGNRAFEDALLELNDCMKERGFYPMASAAVAAQHSIVPGVAAGRPDGADLDELRAFARRVLERHASLTAAGKIPEGLWTEGNRPYRKRKPMPAVPEVSDACVKCGLCAERCPAMAIDREHPEKTDASRCFLCMRCVSICPENARALPAAVQAAMNEKLGHLAGIRSENQFYL